MREFIRSPFLGPTIWSGYRDLENSGTHRSGPSTQPGPPIARAIRQLESQPGPRVRPFPLFICPDRLCLPQVIVLPVRICLTYPSSPYVSPPVNFVVEDPYIDGFASKICRLSMPTQK